MRPLLALSLAVLFAGPAAAADEVAALKYEPRCVFEAVSRRMKAPVRPELTAPAVFYASKTGEVFLIDEAGYYARLKRSPDDSLAHELAHHMQAVYDRADFTQDLNGSYEEEAVDIQTWFRDEVVPAGPSSACAAP